jgi:hypothetical protein
MKYLIHEVMHCGRGKVPEILQDLKIVNQALLNMGLITTSGRFYVDFSDRFDTIVFDQETDSLDKYFNAEREFYKDMDPDSRAMIDRVNNNTVAGYRQIFEVLE